MSEVDQEAAGTDQRLSSMWLLQGTAAAGKYFLNDESLKEYKASGTLNVVRVSGAV